MSHDELMTVANAVIDSGQKRMGITLPHGTLMPSGFPRAELLSINQTGDRNYSVLATALVTWLTGRAH